MRNRQRPTYIVILCLNRILPAHRQPRIIRKHPLLNIVLISERNGIDTPRHADSLDVLAELFHRPQQSQVAQHVRLLKVRLEVRVARVVQQRSGHVHHELGLWVPLEERVEGAGDGEVRDGEDGDALNGPVRVVGEEGVGGRRAAHGQDHGVALREEFIDDCGADEAVAAGDERGGHV